MLRLNIQSNKKLINNFKTQQKEKVKKYKKLDYKIIYINLQERTDRKEIMEKFYKKNNIPVERYEARKIDLNIFKQDHPHLEISPLVLNKTNKKWVNGTLGCYDSHYNILKNFKDNKEFKYLIVLEDDCTISEASIDHCLNFLKTKDYIDILRINCWKPIPKNPFKFTQSTKNSKFKRDNLYYFDGGTHCCIYHVKNIKKVLNFLDNEYVFHIDAVFSTNVINSYVYKIAEKIKYKSFSSIQGPENLTNNPTNGILLKLKK